MKIYFDKVRVKTGCQSRLISQVLWNEEELFHNLQWTLDQILRENRKASRAEASHRVYEWEKRKGKKQASQNMQGLQNRQYKNGWWKTPSETGEVITAMGRKGHKQFMNLCAISLPRKA